MKKYFLAALLGTMCVVVQAQNPDGERAFAGIHEKGNFTDLLPTGITLDLKVFLQGPYDTLTHLMKTNLQQSGLIPLQQPYGPALPYFENINPCWYYTGTEAADSIPQNVVDWVLLELRDAPDAASATPATTIAKKALFLMHDGSIRNLDGASLPVINDTIMQGLFVIVWHRNHAGIINSNPIAPDGKGFYHYDYTAGPGMIYEAPYGASEIEPGVWGMAAGDGNADLNCNMPDERDVWAILAGGTGYLPGDFDLNGIAQLKDREMLYTIIGKYSTIPQ
ncbi:MAG: hypothetical protein JXA03_12285 [Bacteroidales bacterium]|nr:hypothetical protein [Bacteroidales bacterium]